MNNFFISIASLFLFSIITSCNGNKTSDPLTNSVNKSEEDQQYVFEVYDSISIDLLGELVIIDHHQSKDLLLCYDIFSKRIELINQDGAKQASFHREIDDNQGYGIRLGGAAFYKENQIAILGIKGYYFYDFEGNLLEKKPHPFDNRALPLNFKFDIIPLNLNNANYLIALSGPENDKNANDPQFYSAMKWTSITDLNDNTLYCGYSL